MNVLSATTIILLFTANMLLAAPGKVILNSGDNFSGDISKLPDGGCLVYLKTGAVRFEKDEIRRIIIYSTRDTVKERFISSLRMTPNNNSGAPVSLKTPYDNIINRAAKKHSVDPALIKAVIKAESNFNPTDTSCKGACGLMQLMPETARLLGVKSIYSPEENILAGTRYLRDMLYTFNGNTEKAIAAYNAGPTAVARYKNIPPYRETRAYVENVNRYYRKYRSARKITVSTDDEGRLTMHNRE